MATINVIIKGQKFELSTDEAKALFDELGKVFGNHVVIHDKRIPIIPKFNSPKREPIRAPIITCRRVHGMNGAQDRFAIYE